VLPKTPTRLRAPLVALLFLSVRLASTSSNRVSSEYLLVPVAPNMALIPKKYHVFISPSLRRVYLGEGEDTSRAVISGLNAEITLLKARVGTLKRDKDLLMDRCEAAQSAASRLTADERAARLELAQARHEAYNTNMTFEYLKEEHRSLKYM
jgi:hypothetical protein